MISVTKYAFIDLHLPDRGQGCGKSYLRNAGCKAGIHNMMFLGCVKKMGNAGRMFNPTEKLISV